MPGLKQRGPENASDDFSREVQSSLSRMYGGVEVTHAPVAGAGLTVVKRKPGGSFLVTINDAVLTGDTVPDACVIQAISAIELLNAETFVRGKEEYADDVETYDAHNAKAAYSLMYRMVFQNIALHNPNIPPIYYEKFKGSADNTLVALRKKYNPVPQHIQFLLGLNGANVEDAQVARALTDLRESEIVSFILDPRHDYGKKLRTVNAQVVPVYEYFLKKDAASWKPKETKSTSQDQEESAGETDDSETAADADDKEAEEAPGQAREDDSRGDTPEESDGEDATGKGEGADEGASGSEAGEGTGEESGESGEGSEDGTGKGEVSDESGAGGDSGGEGEGEDAEAGNGDGAGSSESESGKESGTGTGEVSDGKGGTRDQTDTDQDAPDYKDTYRTPEGGTFEKVPEGKGFKLEIFPPLNGYYVTDHKSHYTPSAKEWKNIATLSEYRTNPAFTGTKYTMSGTFKGSGLKSLPLPQGYACDVNSLHCTGNPPTIYRDQNGAFYLRPNGPCTFTIDFYQEEHFKPAPPIPEDSAQLYTGTLSARADACIGQAKRVAGPREKARLIRDYIRKFHAYPPGKNMRETMNNAKKLQGDLRKSPADEYIQKLEESKHLECYSAATLMAAMCRAAGVPARVVTGHHVEGRNKSGNAEINSSNGHGWVVIWDGTSWVRLDATPDKDKKDPQNKPDPQEEKKERDEAKKRKDEKPADDAHDGGEDVSDTDADKEKKKPKDAGKKSDKGKGKDKGDGGSDEDGDGEGEGSNDEGDGESGKGRGTGARGGAATDSEIGDPEAPQPADKAFDPEAEFKRMYEELNKDAPEGPAREAVDEAVRQVQDEEIPPPESDPDEESLELKYPALSRERIEELARFVKEFREALLRISQLKNPGFIDGISPNETLEEELRSILDRVISRSLRDEEVPHYPVDDGNNPMLIEPVQRYMDGLAGKTESYAYMDRETIQVEELKIVKIRRRKVLDGSGSMSPDYGESNKLRMQQEIEVLENKVTAEKQEELRDLSDQLDRDVTLETETWQFGVGRSGFGRLKALSSTFDEIEQAAIWQMAGTASGGTNDFDPLEAIYKLILEENKLTPEGTTPVLDRIRAGFLVRERNAHKELSERETEMTESEKIHYEHLTASSPTKIFGMILRTLPSKKITQAEENFFAQDIDDSNAPELFREWAAQFIDSKQISSGEKEYFKSLDIRGKTLADIYEGWLEALVESYGGDVEPILEIIEVSSDGGSNDPLRLQQILGRLRSLGIIVIAYGLGRDGVLVEQAYANPYNPDEGGHHCRNLLDYPRQKAAAWKTILDTV